MTGFYRVVQETAFIFNETAFYLVAGFFLAGVIKNVFSRETLIRHLGASSFGSVFRAALFGVPLPLCSCSVLPTAISMRKMGASKGATAAFLISTPETGIDSIAITYALMDPLMTVIRPLAALLTALFTGTMVNLFETDARQPGKAAGVAPQSAGGCGCSSEQGGPEQRGSAQKRKGFLTRCCDYAFKELFDDLLVWIILGLILSGLIAALVPGDFFGTALPSGRISMLVMLLVGLPLYVCATASTPVAAAFLLKGLNPGAVVVFLLAGPATNIGSVVVLFKSLGKRAVALYLAGIAVMSLVCGEAVDQLYHLLGISPRAIVGSSSELVPPWMKLLFSAVLAGLIINSIARRGVYEILIRPLHSLIGQKSDD